jgi:hypothetical protein
MRRCPKCKSEKEEVEFWKTCSYCKECQKENWRNRIAKNKEEYSARRSQLWKRKNGRTCKKCGETFVGKGTKREYCSTKCKLLGETIKRKNGCWEWIGELHPNGYGQTTNYETSKREHAHRVSYRIFKGEIPKGIYVCHHCDNRKCLAPEHLFLGTAKENMQDAKVKGRLEHVKLHASKGEKNGSAKLKEEDVIKIRKEIAEGKRCAVIAREYELSSTVIYKIRDRESWKHVEG